MPVTEELLALFARKLLPAESIGSYLTLHLGLFGALHNSRAVIICAVQGVAIGGGAEVRTFIRVYDL